MRDVNQYKACIRNGNYLPIDQVSERASDKNLMERFIIFNLFHSALDRARFLNRFGVDPVDAFKDIFCRLHGFKLVDIDDQSISLTKLGKKWRRNVYFEFHSCDFSTRHELTGTYA